MNAKEPMNFIRIWIGILLTCGCTSLLSGCASLRSEKPEGPKPLATIKQDDQSIPIYFPECFLLKGARLNDHGRIPSTPLVGAGMTANESLSSVHSQYQDVMQANGWVVDQEEEGRQSFRMIASLAGATVELRAVQGTTGPTQIFLLYTTKGDAIPGAKEQE